MHGIDVGEEPMEARYPNINKSCRGKAVCLEREDGLVEHRAVRRAGSGAEDTLRTTLVCIGKSPHHTTSADHTIGVCGEHRLGLVVAGSGDEYCASSMREQFGDDSNALLRCLARRVHRFGHSLTQSPVVIDQCVADVGKGQPRQTGHRIVRRYTSGRDVLDEGPQRQLVHPPILLLNNPHCRTPRLVASPDMNVPASAKIGFLGPIGTFTEQALTSQADLRACTRVPYRTMPDVLDAVDSGELDYGFLPIENSIEGSVNLSQDELAFSHSLLIQREVVLDIEHCLVGAAGTRLDKVALVLSHPVATAQCHAFLRRELPQADIREAASTAEAARLVATEPQPGVVAIAPRVAAEALGLTLLAEDIGDYQHNQTRFVLVAREGIPAPTGHDRTALVVYQRADEPGSLISILQEFAARRINLSNLLSRPTKDGGLGDYCFIIYADGHIGEELMADTVRALHAKQSSVKFLGSYPAAGAHAAARDHADERWQQADDWVRNLRTNIR